MALSATVSKVSVTTSQESLYSIVLKLVLADTAGEGFTKEYSVHYRTGDNVVDKQKEFKDQMNKDIANYKSGQSVYNAAALNTVVSGLQSSLTI